MSTDPWTADDPQPGDFDAVLATMDPAYVECHEGNPDATLRVLVSVEGEEAHRPGQGIQRPPHNGFRRGAH